VTGYLGACQIWLESAEVNAFLEQLKGPTQLAFAQGCFHLHGKLPMGLGVNLLVVPAYRDQQVIFSIPFDQIRGDRSGGMAKFLAGGLWGLIRPYLEKTVRTILDKHQLPPHTLRIDQGQEGKSKVGLVVLDLMALNGWLLQRSSQQPVQATLEQVSFTENGLGLGWAVLAQ
jgi:hypothetical protein